VENHNIECRFDKCHYPVCLNAVVIMLSVITPSLFSGFHMLSFLC
jgi:hypothetical protein